MLNETWEQNNLIREETNVFNKIIVALDTHENCSSLFNKALALAQTVNAELKLLNVFTPNDEGMALLSFPSITGPGIAGYPLTVNEAVWAVQQQRCEEYRASSTSILSRFIDQANLAGVQAEFVQVTGDPGRAICDYVKSEQADLIVVGSHRRRGLNELLTGSVSSYIMHRAPCSVLVVSLDVKRPDSVAEG